MIFKRRFSAIFLVLLFSTFVATEHSEDFKFDSDDLQVVYSDPAEIAIKTPSRYSYTKEIAQCPSGESKMMLTLLLQSLRWKDVGEKKKEKAIKKMSRFFLVPVKYIKLDDIHTTEMLEMLKHSINKSNNLLNTKDAVGRIEFMIGCGDKLFASTKTLAHKINEYVKSGKLQELSGLPINWWNIWSKHVKSRVQRTRRDALLEGSGNAEEQDYYDEEDEEFSETEGNEDEDEEINNEEESHKSFSEQVNHQNTNQRKKQQYAKKMPNVEISEPQSKIHDDPPNGAAEIENNERNENEDNINNGEKQESTDYQISPEEPLAPIENVDDSIKEDIVEEVTQRLNVIDVEVNSPTPIGTNEIIKLEKEVDKTIENANNVDDVPFPSKQQDDKILEEFVNSMISNAPIQELTTDSEIFTILTSPTVSNEATSSHHHHLHHHHEMSETVTSETVEIHPESPLSTAVVATEEMINETTTTSTTIVHALEAETIFTPINNDTHNEHINIDEKFPIVTTSLTLDLTTISETTNMAIEKESILIEENITDQMPSLSSQPSSTPLIISSTSYDHETTTYNYPISTNPTILTTTTAEITTIITNNITTSTEPSITETSTTLKNVVDATIAFVAVDKDMSSTEKAIEEKKSDEESNYDDEYDDDEENFVEPSKKSSSVATTASSPTTIKEDRRTPLPLIPTSPDEDDDEDNEEEETDESVLLGLPSTTLPPPTTTTIPSTTTIQTTTVQITSTSTESTPTTSESVEVTSENSDYSEENQAPTVVKRIKKIQATSGKAFSYKLEEAIFDDDEGADSLRLELLDKNDQPLPSSSWVRFDAKKQEIYGLPLENDVSRHEFKLRATDSSGEYVDENVDVTVQQHKGYRSVNHEIFIQVTLDKQYDSDIDWKIRLIRGIVEALEDDSIGSIIVRDVKPHKYEPKHYTFSYTNDTLPKDHCPKEELEQLTQRLTKKALNDVMRREITVRNVEKELINACAEVKTPIPQPPLQPNNKQNYPPTVRNHVDRVGAVVGQLLVFKVPSDTFYDPEDLNDLKLSLLNENRSPLDPTNWLQFDAKNHEFYGVPTIHDKTQTYVLVAEDKNGLSTNDALVVEINNLHSKRDYGATFEYQLEIGIDQFQNAATKRKFIERIQQFFGDGDTSAIVIKSIKKVQYSGRTAVVVQNTTLSGRGCPVDEIKKLKDRLVRTDGSLHDDVREAIGTEFNVQKISIVPIGKCASGDTYHHPDETIPVERPEEHDGPLINEEVLITYVLPTAIILLMLLIALLIACLLYKRRNTGKMELGDEEERKSFRSKGIPVIFQDELDEKPEIVTKSPIILKDEKPPLLPQYNGLNQDGEEDVDQYIPPQPLLMGSRGGERGKSPVSQNTPSYRKPPPYVSP